MGEIADMDELDHMEDIVEYERIRASVIRELRPWLRHHDTCLKAMQWKAVGLDTNPCDCGLSAIFGKGEG